MLQRRQLPPAHHHLLLPRLLPHAPAEAPGTARAVQKWRATTTQVASHCYPTFSSRPLNGAFHSSGSDARYPLPTGPCGQFRCLFPWTCLALLRITRTVRELGGHRVQVVGNAASTRTTTRQTYAYLLQFVPLLVPTDAGRVPLPGWILHAHHAVRLVW